MQRVAVALLFLVAAGSSRSAPPETENGTVSFTADVSKAPVSDFSEAAEESPRATETCRPAYLPLVTEELKPVPPAPFKLPGYEPARSLSSEKVAGEAADHKEPLKLPGFSSPQLMPRPQAIAPLPRTLVKEPQTQWFNNNLVVINYEIKDVGSSGISGVDLWYKQPGQAWTKVEVSSHEKSPYVVEVKEEGVYGFTLIARNGDGNSLPPPQDDDPPQIWAAVDTTKPAVKLAMAEGVATSQGRKALLSWQAQDTNLPPAAVRLAYAEREAGPWVVFASGLENKGSFVWDVPAALRHCLFVRVAAVDRAGNVGFAQPPGALFADPLKPSIAIVSVETPESEQQPHLTTDPPPVAVSPQPHRHRFQQAQPIPTVKAETRRTPSTQAQDIPAARAEPRPSPQRPQTRSAQATRSPASAVANCSAAKPQTEPVALDVLRDDMGQPIHLQVKRPLSVQPK